MRCAMPCGWLRDASGLGPCPTGSVWLGRRPGRSTRLPYRSLHSSRLGRPRSRQGVDADQSTGFGLMSVMVAASTVASAGGMPWKSQEQPKEKPR